MEPMLILEALAIITWANYFDLMTLLYIGHMLGHNLAEENYAINDLMRNFKRRTYCTYMHYSCY